MYCYKSFGSNFVYVIYVLKGTQVLFVALNLQIKVHHKRHIYPCKLKLMKRLLQSLAKLCMYLYISLQ